jgi:CO/xanthine dehydrogenase FAD-binding subunit
VRAGIGERFGILAQAAELVASPQIRHQGTLGGNISQDARCWYYPRGRPPRVSYLVIESQRVEWRATLDEAHVARHPR